MKTIAFNINFDSMNEAFGFPKGFRDPSFFGVFDRFNELALKYNFKYSIFIIGKDLENPEVAARVRDWSDQGHEIGNHTWSHPMNLGALTQSGIEDEVLRAHEIIHTTTGVEPKGFIAPAWNCSETVWDVLIDNNYLYDTSIFPSLLLYPMVLKMAINHFKDKVRLKKILSRKDWLYPFKHNSEPFMYRGKDRSRELAILPLPTTRFSKLGFWHTINFIFGQRSGKKLLSSFFKDENSFYYLLHPADLIEKSDIEFIYNNSLERFDIPLNLKLNYLDECIKICIESGSKVELMQELAKQTIDSDKIIRNNLNENRLV